MTTDTAAPAFRAPEPSPTVAAPRPSTTPSVGRRATDGPAAGAVVGLLLVLAAPLVAAAVHLAATGAATFASWLVLVVGLVAWSPVSRRWSRLRRGGPAVAVLYLGVGAFFLLG